MLENQTEQGRQTLRSMQNMIYSTGLEFEVTQVCDKLDDNCITNVLKWVCAHLLFSEPAVSKRLVASFFTDRLSRVGNDIAELKKDNAQLKKDSAELKTKLEELFAKMDLLLI